MTEFKLANHKLRLATVVEVWVDGILKAMVYPGEDGCMRIISMHVQEVDVEHSPGSASDLGVWLFRFN